MDVPSSLCPGHQQGRGHSLPLAHGYPSGPHLKVTPESSGPWSTGVIAPGKQVGLSVEPGHPQKQFSGSYKIEEAARSAEETGCWGAGAIAPPWVTDTEIVTA